MPTKSENDIYINPSEFKQNVDLNKPLTNDVSGLTYGITYTPSEANRSPLSPTNFIFDQGPGISNGYHSRVNGITDFTAYNDYIHYSSLSDIEGALNGAGITNVSSSSGVNRFNVYNTLIKATVRFEIYSRQYRS